MSAAKETSAGLFLRFVLFLLIVRVHIVAGHVKESLIRGLLRLAHADGLELAGGFVHNRFLDARFFNHGRFFNCGFRRFNGRFRLRLVCKERFHSGGRHCRQPRFLLRLARGFLCGEAHGAFAAFPAGHAARFEVLRRLLFGFRNRLVQFIHGLSSFVVAVKASNEVVVEFVIFRVWNLLRGALFAARRREIIIVRILQRVLALVRLGGLRIVHARHKQIDEFFEAAAGRAFFLLRLPFLRVGIAKFVLRCIEGIRLRRIASGRGIELDAIVLNVVRLRRFRRGRALDGGVEILRRFVSFEGRKLFVGQIVHILQLRFLRFPAAGDAVLYAVEEVNEGIEGVWIRGLVLLRLQLLLVVDLVLVLVHKAGEGIDRSGAFLLNGLFGGELFGGKLLDGRRFPARRRLCGGRIGFEVRSGALRLNRVGRFLRGLNRPRAIFVFLVPPSQLVVIELGAVISGVAHRVTASHCAFCLDSAHAISIHNYYNTF